MSLRHQPISDTEFYQKATNPKPDPRRGPGSRPAPRDPTCSRCLPDNAHRLYHWAQNRQIPAENNLAERDLRPTVIARRSVSALFARHKTRINPPMRFFQNFLNLSYHSAYILAYNTTRFLVFYETYKLL